MAVTTVNQTGASTDSAAAPQSAASKTPTKSRSDSLGPPGQLDKPASSADSLQLNTREMFRSLGNFHKAMGIYNISAGILAVIASAAILDKQDILPFSLSLITLGGITVGIGVWEITIGRTLNNCRM